MVADSKPGHILDMKKTTATSSFETLEDRRMLAVDVALLGGTLVVEGDNANNHIWLSRSNGTIFVNIAGQNGYVPHFNENSVWAIEMYGGGGNDILSVGSSINKPATLWGGPGEDYLVGGAGYNELVGHGFGSGIYDDANDDNARDILISGRGESTLWGQGGNDELYTDNYATSGTDFMFGGDGSDKFFVRGHDGNAWVTGEDGHDVLVVTQAATQNVFYEGGSGTDHMDYSDWDEPVYVKPDGASKSGLRYGVRRHEIGSDVEAVYGTDYNDHFSGNSSANLFFGNGGDDIMYGYGGNDYMLGGDGNDYLEGGSGNDFLHGGYGDDGIYGGSGNDQIYGVFGNDTLYGGDGNDQIWGGDGNDELRGGNGNDALYGENGSDWLYGDAGGDLHVGGSGSDFIYASDSLFGNDTVFGDNINGSGAGGALDVIYADRWFYNGSLISDVVIGSESTVWWPF